MNRSLQNQFQLRGGSLATYLGLFFSISAVTISAIAQSASLDAKKHAPIMRVFDAAKNETMVSVVPDYLRLIAAQILQSSPDVKPSHTSPQSPGFGLRTVYYTYPANTPTRPPTVTFVFMTDEGKGKYKDNLDFGVDLDGAPLHQGKIDYSVKDSGPNQIEVLMASLPTEVFLRMAQGKKVQWTLGTKKYKLTDTQVKDIRALAETVP